MVIAAMADNRHDGPVPDRHVVFVVVPGCQPLDLTGPHEVFAGIDEARERLGRGDGPRHRLTVAAPVAGPVVSESGLRLMADVALGAVRGSIDTLVVAGGTGVHVALQDEAVVASIARLASRSRRVASVCTGSFLLAEAGLLDGRRAATHWARAEQMALRYPAVTVDAEALFVRDGDVWTSAGVTAGLDLALALVEDDHGADVAQLIARWLVMFLRRPGGQTQFSGPLWRAPVEHEPVRAACEAIEAALDGDLTVTSLARRVGLSERHFIRVFTREVGTSPARYVEAARVEAARRLLETTTTPVAVVARACGFGSGEILRRAFRRRLGVAPSDYRDRFRTVGPAADDHPAPAERRPA
jgi:transcriptional regulator GlxA family with amidase domain